MNTDEEDEILAAFSKNGMAVKSQAARVVLLSYARSKKVRDAVAAYVRDNLQLLAS